MPTPVDLLIHSARQLVTCASPDGPKRGAAMREMGVIEDGGLAIDGEKIVDVGPTRELRKAYKMPRPQRTIRIEKDLAASTFVSPFWPFD